MAAYKTGAFVRSKYYTPFQKTPLKLIPRSKSGASKSRPRWATHTSIGNVWEYPPPREVTVGSMTPFTDLRNERESQTPDTRNFKRLKYCMLDK